VRLPDGSEQVVRVSEEKGIDVRLAIDVVRKAWHDVYDVGIIFSQDQDLSEVADEIRQISKESGRWIRLASAYPVSSESRNRRGINKTQWIAFDRSFYSECIDFVDHRGPEFKPSTGSPRDEEVPF